MQGTKMQALYVWIQCGLRCDCLCFWEQSLMAASLGWGMDYALV